MKPNIEKARVTAENIWRDNIFEHFPVNQNRLILTIEKAILEAHESGRMEQREAEIKRWQEISDRITHFYKTIPSGHSWPNSKEGDLIRMVHKRIEAIKQEGL